MYSAEVNICSVALNSCAGLAWFCSDFGAEGGNSELRPEGRLLCCSITLAVVVQGFIYFFPGIESAVVQSWVSRSYFLAVQMYQSNGLEGKVALITGGARGIGECIARLFTKHGAKVIIADILDNMGHSVCEDLGDELAFYVHCDVSNESDIENAVNTVILKYGNLDIMINNAATGDEAKTSILDNEKSSIESLA
ncbi:hypothetical protein TEA_024184 [Camellia sinensis var. sinensis]|uniref:Uncharacterized protein n=1 Tax=Camellia sinensis var. sinensis TaxID=542762 RepID=A0A4S4D396_CAMSN|nr:hypothetical protein TEA_024184 [Camellia sinensis var. sinensis]